MSLTWPEIHELEIAERYPQIVDALEERLRDDPAEVEAVIRLGFNLWYAVVEASRMKLDLPTERYAQRFMELLHQYRDRLGNNGDFFWAFGQGIQLFWWEFPGATEELGCQLIDRACALDPFWARFWTDLPQGEARRRFQGRGILASYYGVA